MKLTIAIPYHNTPKTAYYLGRLLQSLATQTFQDYEVVFANEGGMTRNHNAAMQKGTGEYVKLMQMDDHFRHNLVLAEIVEALDKNPDKEWLISGTLHTDGSVHIPKWNDQVYTGANTLGSISTLTVRRESMMFFEEPLQWLLDVDLYYRYFLKFGEPLIIPEPQILVDVRTDRMSHTIPPQQKIYETNYLLRKYGK